MKRVFIGAVVALATLGSVFAQQQVVADKVVAVVGNSAILYSEVVDFSKQARVISQTAYGR